MIFQLKGGVGQGNFPDTELDTLSNFPDTELDTLEGARACSDELLVEVARVVAAVPALAVQQFQRAPAYLDISELGCSNFF
jgi:hypothetical protein